MVDFSKYYRSYKYMQDMLKSDFTHNYIEEALKDGDEGKDSIFGKTNEKVIDMDWVIATKKPCRIFKKQLKNRADLSNRQKMLFALKRQRKFLRLSVRRVLLFTKIVCF